MLYINFYFKNIIYDEKSILADFLSRDDDVFCSFEYDLQTGECRIWNNNKPIEEITPLPVYWLKRKLERDGVLKENEHRICY